MIATLKFLLVIFCAREALCQYIHHPHGAVSYFTKRQFHQIMDYRYVAPAGQTVNVKFDAASSDQPQAAVRTQLSAAPQFSSSSQFSAPQFVFHSNPAPLALTADTDNVGQQYSTKSPGEFFGLLPNFFKPSNAGPPDPRSLFVLANGLEPVPSDKQIEAYNDDLRELAKEAAISAAGNSQFAVETNLGTYESYGSV